MDNTVIIGQQHYDWKIVSYPWLGFMECTIVNLTNSDEQLVVIVEGNNAEVYNPQNIKLWISFALHQNWKNCRQVYKIQKASAQLKINQLKSSLAEEKILAEKLSLKYAKKVSLLDKSQLKYQLEELHEKLGFHLPTLLQQLYLHLGNGNFGPDYGFLNLSADPQNSKITFQQAYKDLHDGTIQDWNWQLPKKLVPFLYWGNDIYSLVDCSTPEGAVWVLDENLKTKDNKWQNCLWQHCDSLKEWLTKWSAGEDESGRSLWLEMYKIKGLL